MAKKKKTKAGVTRPNPRRVTPLRGRSGPARAALDLHRCEQFLMHEMRLLDEAKFDA